MKAIISDIFLFSYENERRHLSFKEGLNIITGDSKTGKSAIIEIVDFCLFSRRSTIPVGKITDWTELFVVVYSIDNKKLIVARSIDTANKCYFSAESDFDPKSEVTVDYFDHLVPKNREDAQREFERHLGLSVESTKENQDQSSQSGSKVSIRDAATFMFQHQNLVANKHSIFYRFDNYYKREKTISDFPIHLGWADSDYFALKREQDLLLKNIKKQTKKAANLKKSNESKRLRLLQPIEEFYQALGLVLGGDDRTLKRLIKISMNLPVIPKYAHEKGDLGNQLDHLKKDRDSVEKELQETKKLISLVSDNTGDAHEYSNSMRKLVELSKVQKEPKESITCPLCSTPTPLVIGLVQEVKNSRAELIEELSKVGAFKHDNSASLDQLLSKRDELKEKLKGFRAPINHLKKSLGVSKSDSLKAGLYELRGRIKTYLEQILEEEEAVSKPDEPDTSTARLKEIEDEIAGYNLRSKNEEANKFINETMDSLIEKLDFEKELRSGEMKFDLANFDFHYLFKSKRISLSEMGSGANWLACHLSIFLALLKLIAREGSSLPAVLFLDQPSQVYFPKVQRTFSSSEKQELLSGMGESEFQEVDENIKQVVNIFKVIDSFLTELLEDELIKFKPQVIVLEHADEPELAEFVRERWSSTGNKLI